MKSFFICAATLFPVVATLSAQTSASVDKSDVVTSAPLGTGILQKFVPGSAFVVAEESGPVAYTYGPEVTYVTRSGAKLTSAEVQSHLGIGVPVEVEYVKEGESRVIRKVVVNDAATR
ncbi:MAG TPA: hypothetical protein VD994_00650 [Prosthecobacter sp.]|nr:hypothetical protein [Prosthecobacter sp.]